jgi:hypothetical protein
MILQNEQMLKVRTQDQKQWGLSLLVQEEE